MSSKILLLLIVTYNETNQMHHCHRQKSLLQYTASKSLVACCLLLISKHLLVQCFTLNYLTCSHPPRMTTTNAYMRNFLRTLAVSRYSSTAYLETLASTDAAKLQERAHPSLSALSSKTTKNRSTTNPRYTSF